MESINRLVRILNPRHSWNFFLPFSSKRLIQDQPLLIPHSSCKVENQAEPITCPPPLYRAKSIRLNPSPRFFPPSFFKFAEYPESRHVTNSIRRVLLDIRVNSSLDQSCRNFDANLFDVCTYIFPLIMRRRRKKRERGRARFEELILRTNRILSCNWT